jgi:AAA+ ATPase superfamily predicted ATPase
MAIERELAFYGRDEELAMLHEFKHRDTACLIVIKGRRRIGKSRLLREYANSFKQAYVFTGLPPEKKTTAESQRSEFAGQLRRNMGIPPVQSDDWSDLFWFMANNIKAGDALIILDEITWMGSKDPEFLPKLHAAWELHLKQKPHLILAICGSMSVWIEDNILSSTGFMGRPALDMTLHELPLNVCNEFWKDKHISAYEKFQVLSVTGGIPRYLELINPNKTAEQNLQLHCFNENGFLFKEFDRIFSDLFGKRNTIYAAICEAIINGFVTQSDILDVLNMAKSGNISEYLMDLEESGFISREFRWNFSTDRESKKSKYRLSDNYVRFYLKYIAPNKSKITRGLYKDILLANLPGWYTVLGLQFENLILNNRDLVLQSLNIHKEEVVQDGYYFQTKTARSEACQIDYLIQTRTNNYYICEVRFSKQPINVKVIEEVSEKIRKLNVKKQVSLRPVLIHVNGVETAILKSDYFTRIIDFSELLS